LLILFFVCFAPWAKSPPARDEDEDELEAAIAAFNSGGAAAASGAAADAVVDDATAHPLLRLERAKLLRKSSRASMRSLKAESTKATASTLSAVEALLSKEQARERQLSSQIRTLQRSASQLDIEVTKAGVEGGDATGGGGGDTSPQAGTLQLVALLKRKVATRGSGDDDGRTLTSLESAQASIRLFKADRDAMDVLVSAVATRRDARSGDAAPIATACKNATVSVEPCFFFPFFFIVFFPLFD
jgi:hypothetical protein